MIGPAQQATPTFSPVAGEYATAQDVTITSGGADTIYYTTDGSTPTTGSTVYSSPVHVGSSETLKALAVKTGLANSNIGSAAYIIDTVPVAFIVGSQNASVGAQTAATAAVDTTGANFIAVSIEAFTTETSPTVTDNFGNTYHPLTEQVNQDAIGRIYYAFNATVGPAHVVTYDSGTGGNVTAVAMAAFSSVKLMSPFQTENGFAHVGGTVQPGAVSATSVGDLIITGSSKYFEFSTNLSTVDSGFIIAGQHATSTVGTAIAYLIAANLSPVNPTWTRTQVGFGFASEIATFAHS